MKGNTCPGPAGYPVSDFSAIGHSPGFSDNTFSAKGAKDNKMSSDSCRNLIPFSCASLSMPFNLEKSCKQFLVIINIMFTFQVGQNGKVAQNLEIFLLAASLSFSAFAITLCLLETMALIASMPGPEDCLEERFF